MRRDLTLEEDRQCQRLERDRRAEFDRLTALRRDQFDINARISDIKVEIFRLEQSLRMLNALPQTLERRPQTFMPGLMAEIAVARRRGQLEDALSRQRQKLLEEEGKLQRVELDISASKQGIINFNNLLVANGCRN